MRAIVFVSVVACSAPAPRSATHPAPPRHMPTALERAEAFEHGDGVPRDYAAAAAIYRESCAAGAGDLAACRRLMAAELDARGVDRSRPQAFALAAAMCAHDDLTGCLATAMAGTTPPQDVIDRYQRLVAEPCDAAHLARCELPLDPFGFMSQSSSREYAGNEFAGRGCALGVLEACVELRFASGDEHTAAMAVLAKACHHGDATACDAIDQPLDASPLCAAHDYGACMALACAGDISAAELARAHGADADCERRPPYAITPPVAIAPTPQLTFDSLAFRQVGIGRPGPVWFEAINAGTHPIDTALGEVYAYDAAGNQLGRHHFELRQVGLAPGAGTALELSDVEGVTFEPCVDVITFADDRYHTRVARCPTTKARGVRWGTGGDNVLLRVDLDDIPLADDWVSTFVPSLAEPFEQTHAGVVVDPVSAGASAVDLAGPATDLAALTKELGGSVLELPAVWSPVSIAYTLPGVTSLRLSARTLARIFAHDIKRWDDPAIAADNRGHAPSALPIVVIQETSRNDELVVTTYLARFARAAWKPGAIHDKPLPAATSWLRSFEIGKQLADTPGAIAFVGPGVAEQAMLPVAQLQSARGAFVAPTPATVAAGAYPLVAARSLYVSTRQPDRATADAVRAYVAWLLGDGLAIFEKLGYVRRPPAVTETALAHLTALTYAAP
jgi:phosphate transport system substrate-binding protein